MAISVNYSNVVPKKSCFSISLALNTMIPLSLSHCCYREAWKVTITIVWKQKSYE